MKKDEIEQLIFTIQSEIKTAQSAVSQLNEGRRAFLLKNDIKSLNALDRQVAENQTAESRAIERLAVLREEHARAVEIESDMELDRLRAEAMHVSQTLTKELLDADSTLFPEVVRVQIRQHAGHRFIEKANARLGADRQIPLPNEIRREPVKVIPAHDELVVIGGGGIFDGKGRSLDVNAQPPETRVRKVGEERIGGRLPEPLFECVYLPPILWNGAGWLGNGRSYNAGPATRPTDAVKDHDDVIESILTTMPKEFAK